MSKDRATLGQRHLSFWQARVDRTYFVYVIRGGKKTPVKIGKALNPLHRLKTLQTGNPQSLRLLLVVPAGEEALAKTLERVLHQRFADHRLDQSEWFYGPGVEQIIGFVTELALDMVRAYDEGSWAVPTLSGFAGWTEDERRCLAPTRTTIAMTEPSGDVSAEGPDAPMYDFVPTIQKQVRRTMLRAPQHNRGCSQ